MKNLKTIISFMVLTMLISVLPAVSAVEAEQVSAPYEFIAYCQNVSETGNDVIFNLTSATYPSVLYYDFKEGEGAEVLKFTVNVSEREIKGKNNFLYQTSIYKDENKNDLIAWLGQSYYVIEYGGDWYLSELVIDEDEDDDYLLEVGESMTLKEGLIITPIEIDVDGGEAWFTVANDGEEKTSSVVKEGETFEYKEDLNDSGSKDNVVLSFQIETVFAGMNTNLVKINNTRQISEDVVSLDCPDTDLFSGFKVSTIGTTLKIEFENDDDEISLKKDGTETFLERFNFKINEDGDVGGLVKIVEIDGDVVTPEPDVTVDATDDATADANATEPSDDTTTPADDTTTPADADATDDADAPVATEDEPGFEAVFAIAGLLAVAYLVLRKRE